MPQSVNQMVILVLSAVYIALAIGQLIRLRRQTVQVVRDGLVTPFPELGRVPTGA
jgi:hypothetical protein